LKHGANIGDVTLSEHDIGFDWTPLGERFWREAAEACAHKPSDQQLRFACLRHSGLNASDAASRSGYEGDAVAIRVAGHRASKSTAVLELLSYARAETGRGDDGIVSGKEARRILSRIARKGSNTERVKALESLSRLAEEEKRRGEAPEDDGFEEWRMARDFLSMPLGASVWMLLFKGGAGDMGHPANYPLLHDVHFLMQNEPFGPTIWDWCASGLSDDMREHLEKKLADKSYQLETRKKIWAEKNMEPPGLTNGELVHVK
jgi:hypothetical protein